MLQNIELTNFKCFESLNVELSSLNVFAGINSMGKSSVIQAILLLRQSFDMRAITKGLHLNGDITCIGTGYDLLFRNANVDMISISITSGGDKYDWKYDYNKESDFQKTKESNIKEDSCKNINIFYPTFSYVSAERIGPQRFYEKSYQKIFAQNQVGYKGELFADYLAERGSSEKVENEFVLHKDGKDNSLIFQTDAWLSEISPGLSIHTEKYSKAGIIGIEYKVLGNNHTPLNVGFGLSYVAPIIVSLLKAKKGDLVILENPEAHLHPKGQRKIGELIAKTCSGGVQVILETHSDHVLNGIRLSVKRKQIDKDDIRLSYFYQALENKKLVHKKCSPAILPDGGLSDWPDGFFDEWDKAIDELF